MGSEMCIRDRRRTATCRPRAPRCRRGRAGRATSFCRCCVRKNRIIHNKRRQEKGAGCGEISTSLDGPEAAVAQLFDDGVVLDELLRVRVGELSLREPGMLRALLLTKRESTATSISRRTSPAPPMVSGTRMAGVCPRLWVLEDVCDPPDAHAVPTDWRFFAFVHTFVPTS